MFICVGACAQHVPVALCDRIAPGGLLVVPVVATGTRRQAYLLVRRDLQGRLLAPRTVCEASFVPLIDTRDFAPETRALVTDGCSDDEGVGCQRPTSLSTPLIRCLHRTRSST